MGRGLALAVTVQATHFDKSSFMSCIPVMFTNNTNKIRSRIKNIKNIKIDAMCKKVQW